MPKPHKGTILGVRRDIPGLENYPDFYAKNLGYIISGRFQAHPQFGYSMGRTSLITKKGRWSKQEHGYRTCEVETLNSRYTWQEKCT